MKRTVTNCETFESGIWLPCLTLYAGGNTSCHICWWKERYLGFVTIGAIPQCHTSTLKHNNKEYFELLSSYINNCLDECNGIMPERAENNMETLW